MPYVTRGGRGKEWIFDTAEVAAWREEIVRESAMGNVDFNDENELRRRRLLADTQKAELELAEALRQVAPVEQFESALQMVFAEVRAGMRNIPSRVVATLLGETDETKFKSVMQEEIDAALTAFSEMAVDAEMIEAESD